MKEMKRVILITGAAGFIGSNLAKNILQKDSEVQVIGIDKSERIIMMIQLKRISSERAGKLGSFFFS